MTYNVDMSVDTTTVRVARNTRDLLAERARAQGISVARLLANQVAQWERDEWFQQAREASATPDAPSLAEQIDWESSDDDWD